MKHTITEHYTEYYPQRLKYSKSAQGNFNNGFIFKIRLPEKPDCAEEKTVIEIKNALKVFVGAYSFPACAESMSSYDKSDCYGVYKDADGKSPFIKATLRLYKNTNDTEPRKMTLGIPLNLFDAVNDDIYLLYDGVRLAFIVKGEIVNVNFPFGILMPQSNEIYICDEINAGISTDVGFLESSEKTEVKSRSIAFYSARGYNAWAGDVVNFYHNGVYHYLVLLDRHHHGNRFGGGAHSTYHMTTRDFVNWENHGEIYPIQNQWETFGTGTMFFFKNKYYYSHGLHTSRMIEEEKTGSRLLNDNYKKTGAFSAVPHSEIFSKGLFPSGAAYFVSDDGINFTAAEKQIHCSENPSIYKNGESLVMYAGYGCDGVWSAPDIDGPWKRTETDMPIRHASSPVNNSTECPSIFEWNGYKYIIMGFRGYWQSGFENNEFTDLAATGEDIYDGLCVPMVTDCDGRYILSGWVNGYGWGFLTQHRELIQHKNGRLGMRWLPELTPKPDELVKITEIENAAFGTVLKLSRGSSYYFECTVKPEPNGRIGLAFYGDGDDFVLELNTARQKVQTLKTDKRSSFTDEVKALCEFLPEKPDGNVHTGSCDFAITKVSELEKEYSLKLILHYEPKTDSIVIDAEIGGGRTFISNRPDFNAEEIELLAENSEIKEAKLYLME